MEAFQRMSDDPLTVCPACDTPSLKRKIGLGAGIIFKGGGFYETDFKDRKGAKPESSKAGPGESKSEPAKSTPGPVKAASKSDPKPAAD
jgi:putative FmdB family regulatory protein